MRSSIPRSKATDAQPQCHRAIAQSRLRIWKECRRSITLGSGVAAFVLAVLAGYLHLMPPFTAEQWAVLRQFPPVSIVQLVAQRDVVQTYAADHLAATLGAYCCLYVSMQTFAVPGTLSLSMLAGALFGASRGLALVAGVSTLGSCACFGLCRLIGKSLAHAIWPERMRSFAAQVVSRRGDLLNYIVFLRVTPILPNIFINIASPVVSVPLGPFALGTLLGCLPNHFLAVNAGCKLGQLQSLADLADVRLLLIAAGVGVVVVLPVVGKQFWKKEQEEGGTLLAPIKQATSGRGETCRPRGAASPDATGLQQSSEYRSSGEYCSPPMM